MRQALIAVPLLFLTAGAAFLMGRLSATSAAHNAAQPLSQTSKTLEDRTSPLSVGRFGSEATDVQPGRLEDVGETSPSSAAAATLRPEPVGPGGTVKGASKAEAADAGTARPGSRAGEIVAVVKRERASRISRSVGPDGITFEPIRQTAP
jgi:hypothetical protein